jgi:hypothetical protein
MTLATHTLNCWILSGAVVLGSGACSGRPGVARPAATVTSTAVGPPAAVGEPAGSRTTASGVQVWTVGGNRFWIDVPVALGPVDSPGAMAASTRGTADALFPAVPAAGLVRVGISVSHNTAYNVAPGGGLRDRAANVRPPNSTFAERPREPVTPRQLPVSGAADAYLTIAEFQSTRTPDEKAVSLVLQAVSRSGGGYWRVGAYAIGPMRHELLAQGSPLVVLLEDLVRSFSLTERPVARLRATPHAGAARAAAPAPLRIDSSGGSATGASTERDALCLAMKAMADGDPEAWARVVVYGNNSAFARVFDESRLATMRLARAVRSRPVPGIGSLDVSRALESLRATEDALRQIDGLPLPPREGERADEGATGGPTRLIERRGRFYLERYGPDGGPEGAAGDDQVNPFILAFRASAVAYNEAAAKHVAGEFADVRELEAFIKRRRDELKPAPADNAEEPAE